MSLSQLEAIAEVLRRPANQHVLVPWRDSQRAEPLERFYPMRSMSGSVLTSKPFDFDSLKPFKVS